jgi:hypothetical protein
MKKTIILFAIISLSVITLVSCSNTAGNKLTFNNLASNAVYVNFRAELIPVAPGEEVSLIDVDLGTYAYETTFELPAGAVSGQAEGDVSGELELRAGTNILIVYSSATLNDVYILSASMTTSDDLSDDDIDPIGP